MRTVWKMVRGLCVELLGVGLVAWFLWASASDHVVYGTQPARRAAEPPPGAVGDLLQETERSLSAWPRRLPPVVELAVE